MRVFLAGATGVIGRRLVPMLVAAGHEVTGTTRSQAKTQALREAGAEPVVVDALDSEALRAAVLAAKPDAIVHQMTSIPSRIDPRKLERDFAVNDRLRGRGTRDLVAAAQAAGVKRIVAQSIAFAYLPGPPGTLHTETEVLHLDAPKPFKRSAQALHELECAVRGVQGTVLRYGYFYGPGSAISADGSTVEDLRRRRLPIVGGGGGVWSFIHVDDAARATVAALAQQDGEAHIYNVVDDDPAPVREWLPALANAVGAPRPWRVPAPLARLAAGSYGVSVMTKAQGASNALIKQELGWKPQQPSWREGFRTALG
ncbi:MAG TPA: NAD(P)-dependent oxidoreductase [Solirubrobacteraceae bacterium]|jgi:nucleoside-diphosphate-sugar epimerase